MEVIREKKKILEIIEKAKEAIRRGETVEVDTKLLYMDNYCNEGCHAHVVGTLRIRNKKYEVVYDEYHIDSYGDAVYYAWKELLHLLQ